MSTAMNAIQHIRTRVFAVTQTEFARIAGVGQASVSRWERGQFWPSLDELRAIRKAARRRGLDWDDRWFFEAPKRAAKKETRSSRVS